MIFDLLGFGLPGGAEYVVIIFVFIIVFIIASVIPVLAFWRICSKAGFPGALGLLMLVPVGNIFLMLYLAFAEWPALRCGGE